MKWEIHLIYDYVSFFQFEEKYTTFTALIPSKRDNLTLTFVMFKMDISNEYASRHPKATFHQQFEDIHGEVEFDQMAKEEIYFLSGVCLVDKHEPQPLPAIYKDTKPLKLYDVSAKCTIMCSVTELVKLMLEQKNPMMSLHSQLIMK